MEGASSLCKKSGKFSPENLRVKMPRRAFLPALQGSAALHCLRNGYAALPIGARLFGKKDFSSANENVAKKSTAGTGGVGESPFRRECAARPEEWSRRAEPRKRHTRGMFGSKKNRQSQEQVPQKKEKNAFLK